MKRLETGVWIRPTVAERLAADRRTEVSWRGRFRKLFGRGRENRRIKKRPRADGVGVVRRFGRGLVRLWHVLAQLALLVSLLLVAASVPVGLFAGYRYLQRAPHFLLGQVEVVGASQLSVDEVVATAGLDRAVNSLTIDTVEVQRAVQSLSWVRDARVELRLPQTLKIEIRERTPQALLALGSLFMVDEHGEVFRKLEPDEASLLPIVSGFEKSEFFSAVSLSVARERLLLALSALEAWNAAGLGEWMAIGELEAHRIYGIIVRLCGDGTEIWLGEDRFAAKVERAADVLWDLRERGRRARKIYLDAPDALERVFVDWDSRTRTAPELAATGDRDEIHDL